MISHDWLAGVDAELKKANGNAQWDSPATNSASCEIDLIKPPLNDYGNAQRIIALHGADMLYCHTFNEWLLWDGARWLIDRADQAVKISQETMLAFARQAMRAQNGAAAKFAGQCLNMQRVNAALTAAKPHLAIGVEALDQRQDLLNCANGTIDLKTGALLRPKRHDFITKCVPHRYNPASTCATWRAFLSRILPGLEDYMQVALGYSLTAVTSEKVIFLAYGGGNNGKSTLLSTVKAILSDDYSAVLQMESFTAKQLDNNAQSDLADLHGCRFAMSSETRKGQRLDESKLKRICQGMGKIRAVRKYENPFEFPETHKLWIDSNHKPVLNGADTAIWNRMHLIPFDVTIPTGEIDQELPAKLLAEAEGILAWCVAGAVRWYRDRLHKPEAVRQATQGWRNENDALGRFVDERCVTEEGVTVKASVMYQEYTAWAQAEGEEAISLKAFGWELGDRGYRKRRKNAGVEYLGIGLRSQEDQ